MRKPHVAVTESELCLDRTSLDVARAARTRSSANLWLGGSAGPFPGWNDGDELVALAPRRLDLPSTGARAFPGAWLDWIDRRVRARRASGGTRATGIAVVLAYEALDPPEPGEATRPRAPEPRVLALEVDRSACSIGAGRFVVTERAGTEATDEPEVTRWIEWLESESGSSDGAPARVDGAVTTSLSRDRYLRRVERIRDHIGDGDIYQANLCQVFEAGYRGDPWAFHAAVAPGTGAPRAAYLEARPLALASFSPEIFLRIRPPDRIETWPIKGTRRRFTDPAEDRRSAEELSRSEKDRAELMMIVDLERNDLGRVCRTGTVTVPELARLRSFATLHHLVARVEGRLREVGLAELLHATFPGGSISGAPKRRAREILTELEPLERGWFTGSLLWFGDDGSLDSSLLIRSVVFAGERVRVGAGCGIVADSDPEREWNECMDKARAPAAALGFEAEEAR